MKRIISLLLGLLLAGMSMAAAEVPATVTLMLPEADVTMDVPAHWYYATTEICADSPLAKQIGLSPQAMKNLMSDNAFFCVVGEDAQIQMQIRVVPGIPYIDMRDRALDQDELMDGFMEGFTSTFALGDVVSSSAFVTDEAIFARLVCTAPVSNGDAQMLVYICNTNGQLIFLAAIAYPGAGLPVAELDAMVNSIHFLH